MKWAGGRLTKGRRGHDEGPPVCVCVCVRLLSRRDVLLLVLLTLGFLGPRAGWTQQRPAVVLFATGTTSLGTPVRIERVIGTRGTHFQAVRTPMDAFRVPYHQFPPTPAVPVDISQTRTFFASDISIGSAGIMRPGPGVNIFQVHFRAPRDNVLNPPVQIVPHPSTGLFPFLIPPSTDSLIAGGFVIINFLVQTPDGPAPMFQTGAFAWPVGGGPPIVNLNPPFPGFVTSLVGGIGLEEEANTLTGLVSPRLGSWEVVRSGFDGLARVPLEAKQLVILAARDYFVFRKLPLQLNDSSLINGGGFDINGRWLLDTEPNGCFAAGHCTHRDGKAVDIGKGGDPRSLNDLLEVIS